MQSVNQNQKTSTIHNGSGDINIINVQVNGPSDWLDVSKVDAALIQPILKMLKERKIEGLHKTEKYLRENTYTIDDYKAVIDPKTSSKVIDRLVDEIIDQTKGNNGSKIYTEPLRMLFGKIFQSSDSTSEFTLDDMCRRPIHLHSKSDALCDVIAYRETKGSDAPTTALGWQRAHWHNLLSDILHTLGQRIHARIREKAEEENEDGDDDEDDDAFWKSTEVPNEKAKPKDTFEKWWRRMKHDRELLLGDESILRLMNNLSGNILRECNNDLMKGWHRLIQYCAMLHDEGTIKIDDKEDKEKAKLKVRLREVQDQMDDDSDYDKLADEERHLKKMIDKFDARTNITREAKKSNVMRGT